MLHPALKENILYGNFSKVIKDKVDVQEYVHKQYVAYCSAQVLD